MSALEFEFIRARSSTSSGRQQLRSSISFISLRDEGRTLGAKAAPTPRRLTISPATGFYPIRPFASEIVPLLAAQLPVAYVSELRTLNSR